MTDDQPDTRTPEERYEAGAARARARYAKRLAGDIPIASQLSPIGPTPHSKEK